MATSKYEARIDDDLKGYKIAFLATNGFEQVELTEPKKNLEKAGAAVYVIAPEGPDIRGWNFTEWGDTIKVDVLLNEAEIADYDALVLPGGVINPDKLRVEAKAISFIQKFAGSGKPIAAICHGPQLLIESALVKGRPLTSYPSIKTDLVNAGAVWEDGEVVQDGNLITSRKPDDIPAFSRAIARAIVTSRVMETAS